MATDNQAKRFLDIVGWAANRYRRNGLITAHVGGIPTRFKIIEDLAWVKYIGGDPLYPNHSLLTAARA